MEQSDKKKIWLDECTSEEVQSMWDEAENESYKGLRHPDLGHIMEPEEAKALIAKFDQEAKAKEARIAANISAAQRGKMAKRRKLSKRAKVSKRNNR